MPGAVAQVEPAHARLLLDAVAHALDEAVEPRLQLTLRSVGAQRDAATGTVVVRRPDLARMALAVMRRRIDPEQLVLGLDAVDEPQVAAAVHVVPAGVDVNRHGDLSELVEHRALAVDRSVELVLARLDRELLLRAV